jgi:hypothetical protein
VLVDSPFYSRRRSCSLNVLPRVSDIYKQTRNFKSSMRLHENPVKLGGNITNMTNMMTTNKMREGILQIGYHNPDLLSFTKNKGTQSRKPTVEGNTDYAGSTDDIINVENIAYDIFKRYSVRLKEKNLAKNDVKRIIDDVDLDVQRPLSRQRSDCRIVTNANKPRNNVEKVGKTKLEEYIEEMNKNISVKDIDRKFSISLKQIVLNEGYMESLNLPKNQPIDFEIMMKIYCGNKAITKSIHIPVKKYSHNLNFLIARRIYFDIRYSELPLYSNIIFKIKTTVTEEKNKPVRRTIAWVNFRLFDYLRRLRTGLQKVSFWNTSFSDDSYFQWADNYQDNTGFMFFGTESFIRPVEFINPTLSGAAEETGGKCNFSVLERILKKNYFDKLTDDERLMLWNNRHIILDKPAYLPRLFSCVDYRNTKQLEELQQFIKVMWFYLII